MKSVGIILVILLIIAGVFAYTQRHTIKSLVSGVLPTTTPGPVTPNLNPEWTPSANTIPTETPDQVMWDKQLTPIINSKNVSNYLVRVQKLIGNYAVGTEGILDGPGNVWYAVRITGEWQVVWRGQNSISCKPVQQYNIPKEIYSDSCSNNY